MAQEDIKKVFDDRAGGASDSPGMFDEFDRAVTTRISLDAVRAPDEDMTDDPALPEILDTKLDTHDTPLADDSLEIGTLLKDRFEIVQLVHSSVMGHVYKAVDRRRHPEGSGDIHVAIKMMRRSIARAEETVLAIEREAVKAQSLSHPNIINIFDFDRHDDRYFLVMEWLDGESVNALLRRTSGQGVARSLSWKIVTGAAAALQHAHRHDVVHADVNPSNIFITTSGNIKLLDFGVARDISPSGQAVDGRLAWVTRTYASPQVLSGVAPTFEDDIFSLGCVAYRLLCGRHPFGGKPSLVAWRKNIVVQPDERLTEGDWDLLRLVLAFDRAERPQDVAVFYRGEDEFEQTDSDRALAVRAPRTIDGRFFTVHEPERRLSRRMSLPFEDAGTGARFGAAALAVLLLVSAAWWLSRAGTDVIEPATSGGEVAASLPADGRVPSAADSLVAVAMEAINAGKFVTESGDDARTLFRYAVAVDPNNAAALRGLRIISDAYVQQANEALATGNVAAAYEAITIAEETDSGNPSIAITNRLMASQGDAALSEAQIAAAEGNLELATEQLVLAEQFRHIQPETLDAVRQQILQIEGDRGLVSGLVLANTKIDEGRLTPPGPDNAFSILTRLRRTHGEDARLRQSMVRLGERLLTRAAFATAASQFDSAADLLDAVGDLGVLPTEVDIAREALREAQATATADSSVPERAGASSAAATVETAGDEVTNRTDDTPGPVAAESPTPTPVDVNSVAPADTLLATNANGDFAVDDALAPSGPETIYDKGIVDFSAPVYPLRALRRDITGQVDVQFNINPDGTTADIRVVNATPQNMFESSAINAVRKWRFEPRAAVDPVRIILRFELPPEAED